MRTSTLAAIERAAAFFADGQASAAAALLEDELPGADEARALLHQILAKLYASVGRCDAALRSYAAAETAGGLTAELAFGRAELLRGAGRQEEALLSYSAALACEEDHGAARLGRAVLLGELGRREEALADYDALCAAAPSAQVFNNRGILLQALGRQEEALASYDAALWLADDHALAHYNRGSVLSVLNRGDEAVGAYGRAATLRPDLADAWNARGVLLSEQGADRSALADYDRAILARPGYPEALNNRSIALRRLDRYDEAAASAAAALAERPDWPPALNSLAAAFVRLHRYGEAIAIFDALIRQAPDAAATWINHGMALEAQGSLPAALASFDRACALDPHGLEPRFHSALCRLRSGELREGFRLYEARWREAGGQKPRYPRDGTLWTGAQPIAGRTLLVHAEQGLGDVIQFCRFLPAVRALGARVVFEAPPPLKPLMATCAGWDALVVYGETVAYDVQTPLMSLPHALDVDLGAVSSAPYLAAAPERVAAWRRRLPPTDGLCVGLAWTGNALHHNDRNRSIALSEMAALLDAPVQFVSLQREHRSADRPMLASARLPTFEAELSDFGETAALAACCDLVIAVDTSVAHLAGALGRPLWVMLSKPCEWRWMEAREDTPWYASAKLYRQTHCGQWADVIERMSADLHALVDGRGSSA